MGYMKTLTRAIWTSQHIVVILVGEITPLKPMCLHECMHMHVTTFTCTKQNT